MSKVKHPIYIRSKEHSDKWRKPKLKELSNKQVIDGKPDIRS